MKTYPFEVQDQVMYFGKDTGYQMLQCVLTFKRKLDEKLLKRAVEESVQVEELLACKLYIDNDMSTPPSWQLSDKEHIDYRLIETGNIDDEIETFLTTPIDPEKELPLRIRLFRADTDTLCIKLSHVAADAGGLKQYMTLLAEIYSSLEENGSYNARVAEYTRDHAVLWKDVPESARKYAESSIHDFAFKGEPVWGVPSTGEGHERPVYIKAEIDSDTFTKMKRACLEHESTINDLLLSAYSRAMIHKASYPQDKAVRVQVAVDLRRYLANPRQLRVCNFLGVEYPAIHVSPDESFADILVKVKTQMNYYKEHSIGLTSAIGLEELCVKGFYKSMENFRFVMREGRELRACTPVMTNLGKIPDECSFFGSTETESGYLVSPLMFAPNFMLGISSFKKSITLTIGFCEDSVDRDLIRSFLDFMLEDLASL